MGRAAPGIVLSEAERAELESLGARSRRVRPWRGGRGSCSRRQLGLRTRRSVSMSARRARRLEYGVAALRSTGWAGFTTNPGPARRARSGMRRWPIPSAAPWGLCRTARRIGRYALWPRPSDTRPRRSIGYGGPLAFSRIAARPSSCPRTRFLWKSCVISSASLCRPRCMPWFCASTKIRKFRHLIAANPYCQCAPVRPSAAPMTTPAMAPHRCLLPSTSPRAASSVTVTQSTGPRSFANPSTGSKLMCPQIWTFTSSWTITPPTRPSSSAIGWRSARDGRSTSRQPGHHGSLRSSGSLP